VLHTAI